MRDVDYLDPISESTGPTKSITEILATGIQHAGGMRMVAEAELTRELMGGRIDDPVTNEEREAVRVFLDHLVEVGPAMTDEERRQTVETFRQELRLKWGGPKR